MAGGRSAYNMDQDSARSAAIHSDRNAVPRSLFFPRATAQSLRALLVAALAVPLLLFAAFAWQSRNQELSEAASHVRTTTDLLYEHALKLLEVNQLVLDRVDEWV